MGAAMGVVALLFMIIYFLWLGAKPVFSDAGIGFFWRSVWDPVKDSYGALPVIFGTVVSSLLALCISTPLSLSAALFLNELAPRRVATSIGFLIQMLAAIPSVVYGLWGIFVLAPWLRNTVEPTLANLFGFLPLFSGTPRCWNVGGRNHLAMVTPPYFYLKEIFSSVSPKREAALALGATDGSDKIAVLASSKSGVLQWFLGLGEPLETKAVTMVIEIAEISASLLRHLKQWRVSLPMNKKPQATPSERTAAVGIALQSSAN
jgi:phosphate transport system permease protein